MTITKTAVDEVTKSYWTEYFGDYGRQWVREIPRYIRAAIEQDMRKSAAAGEPRPFTVGDSDRVTPLAYAVSDDRLVLEGRWVGDVQQGRHTNRKACLFRAEFSHDGDLASISTMPAPAR